MFTGIIEEVGAVKQITHGQHSEVLNIQARTVLENTKIGDSIAVNGICLTVTRLFADSFSADVMHETLNRSSLKGAKPGMHVNLERAMAADGRFGGHIVAGHVDGVGTSWDLMRTGAEHFGLTAKELPLDEGVVTRALKNGQPIICSVGPGDFTTSGHFIVLVGMEDGKIRVNDPNRHSTSSQLWDYDTLAGQINNLWAYSLA